MCAGVRPAFVTIKVPIVRHYTRVAVISFCDKCIVTNNCKRAVCLLRIRRCVFCVPFCNCKATAVIEEQWRWCPHRGIPDRLVCALGVNNTCEQRVFFSEHKSPYLNVKNSEVWRKIKILALYSQFLALVHEELFPTSVLCARGSGERCTQPEQSASWIFRHG